MQQDLKFHKINQYFFGFIIYKKKTNLPVSASWSELLYIDYICQYIF